MQLSLFFLFLQLWWNVEVSLAENACPNLPDVPHAHVTEDTRKAEYQAGDMIHFTCETGYISGPTMRYICSSTGQWMALRQGSCYLKPCELPDETPNGYYQMIRGEELVFGTTIKYYCNEGYQMVSKDDTRTCLLDQWSNHVPVCEPLSCEPPPTDGLVTIQNLPENDNPILPDRFITYSCDVPGKYLNGSSVLICGKDGHWDNPFPSCEDIACEVEMTQPDLTVVGLAPGVRKIKIGHKLQFRCDDQNTVLDGSQEIECLPSGNWNAPFPTCSHKCQVTGLSNKVSTQGNLKECRKGQALSFFCVNDEEVLRGSRVVECLAGGQWSAPFPTCEVPFGCGKPPLLADGDTVETVRFQYRHGERVAYTCQNEYVRQGGPYKTCFDNKWIGEIRCLKPCTVDRHVMRPYNIEFKKSYLDKLYAPHNDHLTFICISGTTPVDPESMRQRCDDGVMHLPTCH